MAREPRNELAPGRYHVGIRGNDGMDLVRDDVDRADWHRRLATAAVRFEWNVELWTLMTNHCHWLLETTKPNLGEGMRWLNGGYSRAYNRRHGRRDHLFGERFWSERVERTSHALSVIRYIALNAVGAGMCRRAEDYRWCSYAATIGAAPRPSFLRDEWILGLFGGPTVARARLAAFVDAALEEAAGRLRPPEAPPR
jgi:REP element-mobilizing transposase RayT